LGARPAASRKLSGEEPGRVKPVRKTLTIRAHPRIPAYCLQGNDIKIKFPATFGDASFCASEVSSSLSRIWDFGLSKLVPTGAARVGCFDTLEASVNGVRPPGRVRIGIVL